ncbi:MAG: 50S ribosomal protein L23 [Capsulimonadaceae bacterium]|nr:50S ribosomal protein L23 [Capsulimonadaceae bacterium]
MSSTTKSPYEIILRPIVTEKSVNGTNSGKYIFAVTPDANKFEIAWAVEKIQAESKNAIKVVGVNTVSVKGKSRRGRFGRRGNRGMTSDWKKAIITLAPGQSIELVEGV